MATKTARFELDNPYQKYGLKRRPTFNEILGLLSEDQKLLRPFLDRTATQFRNSPQGSFFDGSDHVELLKEQQNRVLDRQMREMILRKQAQESGGTFHLQRHQDNRPNTNVDDDDRASLWTGGRLTPSGVSESQIVYSADAQREMEQRARGLAERQQQIGQRHGEAVNRLNDTLTRNMLRSGFNDLRGMPESEPLQDDVAEEELIPADDTVRPYQKNVLYFNNDIEAMRNNERLDYNDLLFQLYVRGRLTNEISKRVEDLPDETSKKIYLLTVVRDLIGDGTGDNNWQIGIDQNLLNARIKEWREMKRGGGGGGRMLRQFLASAGSSVLEAGKEVAKEVAIRGARSALGV